MVEESMQQADPSGSQDEAQASPYGRPPMAPPERWRILVALSAGQGPGEQFPLWLVLICGFDPRKWPETLSACGMCHTGLRTDSGPPSVVPMKGADIYVLRIDTEYRLGCGVMCVP